MAEIFDLYDQYMNPLGETLERGNLTPDGKFHVVVAIMAINFEGKMLITQRDPNKKYGGFWEITEGAVISGETPLEGAIRELREETGLRALPEALEYRGQIVYRFSGHNHILFFYLFRADFHEEDIVLQEGETVAARLVYPDEIIGMTKRGEFLNFVAKRIEGVYRDVFGES